MSTDVTAQQDKKKTGQTKSTAAAPVKVEPAVTAAFSRKKANLKDKAGKRKSSDGPVLGGADYVDLMMGGRRKAKVEAAKLPKDD
ncbi:hypothetical protein GLOTRDRAFT_49381 [Gloeophyllum trabeum ATCC 11539]|uniref:Uncharacterized protein n=1 Tax=Gloeophyllum trabeum (strain ATCC 11539 / FP-39264 / Madison 617) TaxID=670483 RepID=S7PUJ2_GLOTA|nr:uncharacterized protein GLOTRDRAFT_49381 [Gloeophyllum trabeum ATCC 11539]EPQ51038.1 hypothetical protein GLOTRDRAFT_49381 [Gloeophyllum trabeum ATCC 11539]